MLGAVQADGTRALQLQSWLKTTTFTKVNGRNELQGIKKQEWDR